jgi:Fe-S-cluster containining protein
MKLHVVQGQRFSCHSCTDCCRNWHVELLEGEAEAITQLPWRDGDPMAGRGESVLRRAAGKTYLEHASDGACVFLNTDSGKCRIHERFGGSAKPRGCQLFPFHLATTFPGQVSATLRYECPSARKNIGQELSEQRSDVQRVASSLTLGKPFDELTCDLMEEEQVRAIAEFAAMMLGAFEGDDQKAMFLGFLTLWLAEQDPRVLDRASLGAALEGMQTLAAATLEESTRPPGTVARLAFRTLWGLHLRRDEDVLDGRASRAGRLLAMTRLSLGYGSPHGLGVAHPAASTRAAKLFRKPHAFAGDGVMELHWRMVKQKLLSLQFMGSGNGGRDTLRGLRSVALLYPMVVASAKHASAARRGGEPGPIEAQDVDVAVAAIEHGFGRSRVLASPAVLRIEELLLRDGVFGPLVRWV